MYRGEGEEGDSKHTWEIKKYILKAGKMELKH